MITPTQITRALGHGGGQTSDFDLNPDFRPPDQTLRPAAVLVLLNETGVVLTKRAAALRAHPGQIAFAGGAQDRGENLQQTALREAGEEIGLIAQNAQILGTLPPHRTVTGFQVTPFVAWLGQPQNWQTDPAEVAEVFTAPLPHVLRGDNFQIEHRIWQGQKRYYYTVPYGPYYIWGATARMLFELCKRLGGTCELR